MNQPLKGIFPNISKFLSGFKRKIPVKFALIFFLCLVTFLVSYFRVFENYEIMTYDIRLSLRPHLPISDKIIIIEISDDTLKNLGKWPLPRDFHASLITVLTEYGVKEIVVDILFSEPTLNDQLFRDAIKKAGNVYLPLAFYIGESKRQKTRIVESVEIVSDGRLLFEKLAAGYGYINAFVDHDGKVRRIPLFIKYKNKVFPQLSLLAACDYLDLDIQKISLRPGEILIDNKLKIPLNHDSSFMVNYPGKWKDSFLHLSYFEILKAYNDKLNGKIPELDLNILKGKICFIGLTATGTSDLRATPLENNYPMLGLQASVFNSILEKKFIIDIGPALNALMAVIIFLLSLLACLKLPPFKALYANILLGIVYFFISTMFLALYGVLTDIFFPLAMIIVTYSAAMVYKFIEEERKRQILENELGIAKTIQSSFLPQALKEFKGISIASFMRPAKFVAGDLYDIVELDENRLGILIGDVSGKGVSASLIMAQAISQFRIFCRQDQGCSAVLNHLNKELYGRFQGAFVTCLYLILDTASNRMYISSAGHSPLLLYQQSSKGIIELDLSAGFPLGVIDDVSYDEIQHTINKQDKLFFFTDGLYEARNKKGQEFEIDRVKKIILENSDSSAAKINEAMEKTIFNFSDSRKQHDDITFIVLAKEI